MLKKYIGLALLIASINLHANKVTSLKYQMENIKVDTALVLPSQSIDEYPLWSEDGKSLFSKVAGKWYRVDLENITLELSKWRKGKELGVINSIISITKATKNEIIESKSKTVFNSQEYISKNKIKFQLLQNKLGTQFIITHQNNKPEIQWSSGSENCHSITTNKQENYIAFICELNGVFVYKIDN